MRFVNPVTVKKTLTGEDWIEIKDQLSVGDQKRIEASGLKRYAPTDGNRFDVDFAEFSFARTVAYLTDWSFKDANGKDVPVSRAAIEALNTDTYKEIEDAITAHVEAREAAKKTPAGA